VRLWMRRERFHVDDHELLVLGRGDPDLGRRRRMQPVRRSIVGWASRSRATTIAAAAVLLLGALVTKRAQACSVAGLTEHPIDPSSTDDVPPAAVEKVSIDIMRGHGPESSGCNGSHSETSCDDLGIVGLRVTPPEDDSTPGDQLGFVITLTAGKLPGDVVLPPNAVRGFQGSLPLVWIDGASDEQEPIDFTVTLSAVDEAGNVGPPSNPIRIQDPGSSEGCGTASSGLGSWWPGAIVMLLALHAVRRLSRRRARVAT
jgi:hypothetical protein